MRQLPAGGGFPRARGFEQRSDLLVERRRREPWGVHVQLVQHIPLGGPMEMRGASRIDYGGRG